MTAFLNKGTKDEAAVGGNEEGVGVTIGTGPPLGAEPGMLGSGAVDIASLVAASKAKGQDGSASKAAGDKKKDAKKDPRDKSGDKKKSSSKGKGGSSSPGKKGGKKKKSKDGGIDLDWAIPEGITKGLNLFLPDRA